MADDFHEVLFPLDVSLRASGGPQRLTEIVTLASGREHRNGRWADSRRRYDAGFGLRGLDALHAVLAFFEERRGRLYGFRFRDRVDGRSGRACRKREWAGAEVHGSLAIYAQLAAPSSEPGHDPVRHCRQAQAARQG